MAEKQTLLKLNGQEEMVREAARIGAREAIDGNRWKRTRWAALIGALVATAIGLPVTIILTQNARDTANQQVAAARVFAVAQTNRVCHVQQHTRILGNQSRFALRELLAFDTDILQAALHPQGHPASQATLTFIHRETTRLQADLVKERLVTPGLPAHLTTFVELLPLLRDLPVIHCRR